LEKIEASHVAAAVVLLDACRADPFVGTGPEDRDLFDPPAPPTPATEVVGGAGDAFATTPIASTAGLASVDTGPMAVLLEYAAQPDHAAFSLVRGDPPTAGSIFTRMVTSRLRQIPNQPIKEILSLAETDVYQATAQRQKPFQNPFGLGYLMLANNPAISQMESEIWARTASSPSTAEQLRSLRDFLRQFPNSDYAFAARQRIAEIVASGALLLAMGDFEPMAMGEAYEVVGQLQSIARDREGSTIAVANRDIPLRGNWETIFKSRHLGTIKTGDQVRVLGTHSGGDAVRVLTEDGKVGYVGNIGILKSNAVKARTTLVFPSSDPFAEPVDWAPLANLRPKFAGSTAVTIRTAPEPDSNTPDQVAQLRALRLRDAIIAQGVKPDRVTIESSDSRLPAHTAEITITSFQP